MWERMLVLALNKSWGSDLNTEDIYRITASKKSEFVMTNRRVKANIVWLVDDQQSVPA